MAVVASALSKANSVIKASPSLGCTCAGCSAASPSTRGQWVPVCKGREMLRSAALVVPTLRCVGMLPRGAKACSLLCSLGEDGNEVATPPTIRARNWVV